MEFTTDNNIKLILQDNESIEKAIHTYYEICSEESVRDLLSAVYMRILDKGRFLLPCDKPENENGAFDFKTLELTDGSTAIVAFTTQENLALGPQTEATTCLIIDFFKAVLEKKSFSAVLLNPWKEPFMFTKEIISWLIKAEEEM